MYTYNRNDQPRKFWYILFILSLGVLIVFIVSEMNSTTKTNDALSTAFVKGNPKEKRIALTFNISWGDEKVHDILKVLHKHQVQATFFVSGEWAERHPQIVQQITEQGHELGMLGYRYKNYLEQEIDQVRKDILYAKEVFRKLGYKNITYIRPPSGLFNEEIIDLIEKFDLKAIHWSVNTEDWTNPGVDKIVAKATAAEGGDIILMHASDAAKQTAAALEVIIPDLQKKGFTFVSITELENDLKIEAKQIN